MTTPASANRARTCQERRADLIDAVTAVAAPVRGEPVDAVDHTAAEKFTDRGLAIFDERAIKPMVGQVATEARFRYSTRRNARPADRRACEYASEAEAEVARLRDLLAIAQAALDGHVCGSAFGSVTGTSRKLTLEWSRIRPGIEGRLLAFGGGDDPHAWIDARTEKSR